MTPELWARLNPLFNSAVERPPAERSAFIAEACGNDEELRRELAALIDAHAQVEATTDNVGVDIKNLIARTQGRFSPSDIVLGRFKIVRQLGSGGMGEVYEAIDLELAQTVALKSIRSDIAGNEGILSRFKREVQLARRLSGPNICRIHELFVIPGNGGPSAGAFLTMELLNGVTLTDKVKQSGPIPWRDARAIANDMCAGLSAMHELGIIHRDLKSRNIMLADRGGSPRAVLMDFGLARDISGPSANAETALTAPGMCIGTPEYMAPEQFEGREASPATDIYALGIVLYEMLTGKHPFAASNAARVAMLRSKKPEPASSIQRGVPHRWDMVIGKCLEYDPKRRYQSAKEMADALRNPFPAFAKLPVRASNPARKLVAGLAVGIGLAGPAFLWRYQSTSYQAPDPRVSKWYEDGTAALREGAYLQATSELQEAVNLDPKFGLAHARLAEAWADLDFTGKAADEMLDATTPERERNLPDLDRRYIEAVRSTLLHDFPDAVRDFSAILDALPADQKGYGYVDLGQAQERAGNIQDALTSYEAAAKLTPDNPAPFVHLGILKGRLQDAAGSEAAYNSAEHLYELKHNLEGLGEVAFQRGHSANERGDSAQASVWLEQCLRISHQIPSVQLEVRALTQRSNVEYDSNQDKDHDKKALEDAEKAVQLGGKNNLEYWQTDGLMREGNAYLDEHDFADAEKVTLQALSEAEQNKHAHLTADIKLTLSSIEDQQDNGNIDDQIKYAREALQFFTDWGFRGQMADAEVILIRGQTLEGDLTQALQSSLKLLDVSKRIGSPSRIELAEETLGGVLLELERFPEALAHFQEAVRLSRITGQNIAYELSHCADVLWRLGRDREADEALSSIPDEARTTSDIVTGIDKIRASMLLTQLRFAEARAIGRHARQIHTDLSSSDRADFGYIIFTAELGTGNIREARSESQALALLAQRQKRAALVARSNYLMALLDLRTNAPFRALQEAEAAQAYFADKQENESSWMAQAIIAKAEQETGNHAGAVLSAKKALDTLQDLQQNWDSPSVQSYKSRLDIQATVRQLQELIH
jgi:serine/threonine protein kinase